MLRSVIFTIYASRHLEAQPIEIANLTKQHNLPLIPFGQTNTQEYKDYTIDLSGIARTMLSHDLPASRQWAGGTNEPTSFTIDGEYYISLANGMFLPTSMNNVTLWVRADAIIQSPSTGLTSIQPASTGESYVGFIVGNTVNDSVADGATKTEAYRIGSDANAKFLNKMRSDSEGSLKNPMLGRMVTQRPHDEASLYGFWSKPVTDAGQYGFVFYFKDKNNNLLDDCQFFIDANRLSFLPNTYNPDDYINRAGRFFQLTVGLKTLMMINNQVMAHVLNDNLGSYFCHAIKVSDGSKVSESRYYKVEHEKGLFTAVWGNGIVGSPTNMAFSDSTEWVFTGSSGTKGWNISGGKLTGFTTAATNQIVYNPNVTIMGGRMYKMTVKLSVVPSDDSTVEIGTYDTSTSTFKSFGGFFIPQDKAKGSIGEFTQEVYFGVAKTQFIFTSNIAFRKLSGKSCHSMDNIEIELLDKLTSEPRLEAYPDLRVYWLNRLGAMDYYDFSAEYKEDIEIKRSVIHTEDEMVYDPSTQGRNSNTGGLHHLPDVGVPLSSTPYGYESVEGTGNAASNPYGNAGYSDQNSLISPFNAPHKRNKAALSSEIKRKYKLSSGEIPTWLARDLEDLLTSNAIYIQRWHNDTDDMGNYGNNYLEPVLMEDGSFNIVDEARQSVRLDITLESAKKFKTQHGI